MKKKRKVSILILLSALSIILVSFAISAITCSGYKYSNGDCKTNIDCYGGIACNNANCDPWIKCYPPCDGTPCNSGLCCFNGPAYDSKSLKVCCGGKYQTCSWNIADKISYSSWACSSNIQLRRAIKTEKCTECGARNNECSSWSTTTSYEYATRPKNDNQQGVCLNSQKQCSSSSWKDWYSSENMLHYETAERTCDGLDNNCNNQRDEGCDDDNDTYADDDMNCTGYFYDGNGVLRNCTTNSGDANDTNPLINPATVWYRDSDEDGFGNLLDNLTGSNQPEGYILIDSDCNDSSASIYPQAPELCSGEDRGVDNNCNIAVDELCVPPEITIILPQSLPYYYSSSSVYFNIWLSENAESCSYSLDGAESVEMDERDRNASNFEATARSISHGSHTLSFFCIDEDGWEGSSQTTFSVDISPPEIGIISPSESETVGRNVLLRADVSDENLNSASIRFEITEQNENDIIYQGAMNPESAQIFSAFFPTNDTWPYDSSVINSMNFTITVYASDIFGRDSSASSNFVLDNNLPSIEIIAPYQGRSYNSDFSMNIFVQDNSLDNSNYYIQNNLGNIIASNQTAISGPVFRWQDIISGSLLPQGDYKITVQVSDSSGNINNASADFVIDRTAPTITLLSPEDGANYTNPVQTINVQAPSDAYVWYEINNINYPYSGSVDVTFNEGYNTLNLWANDSAGNIYEISATFLIDSQAPSIEFIDPTEISGSIYSRNNIKTNAASSDSDLSSITTSLYNLGGLLFSIPNSASPFFYNFEELNDGDYQFSATACDALNNCASTETRAVALDTIAPEVSIIYPSISIFNSSLLEARLYASDLHLDSLWFSDGVSTRDYTGSEFIEFPQGNNILEAWANDSAGNIRYSNFTFFVDSIAPVVTITNPADNSFISGITNVSLEYSISEANPISCIVSIDSQPASIACESTSYLLENLAEGFHTVEISVTDIAGNSNSETRTFEVDTTAPIIGSISSPVQGEYYNTDTISLEISANGNASSCKYSIDSGSIENIMETLDNIEFATLTPALEEGSHNITFYCNDTAGNTENSAAIEFIIDTILPSISIISPENNSVQANTTRLLNISASDSSTYTITYNWNSAEIPYTAPEFIEFSSGAVILTATVTDAAGNINTAEVIFFNFVPKTIEKSTIYGEYYPLNTTDEVKTTTVINSTINLSSISDNGGDIIAEIHNSNIQNCTLTNVTAIDHCNCRDSSIKDGECVDLYIDPSNITGSNTTGSVVMNSRILFSNATDSTSINSLITYSDVKISFISNSTICYSRIINSTIINSYVCYSEINDSYIYDNIICNGTVIFNGVFYNLTDICADLKDIINFPPTAVLTGPSSGTAGASLNFDGSSSSDPNIPGALNDSLTYEFRFGDGASSSAATAAHIYSSAGNYNVSLKVTDKFGASSTDSKMVSISSSGGSSSGGGGGGSATPVTSSAGSNVVYLPNVTQMLEGYNIVLKEKDIVKFFSEDEFHYTQVMKIISLTSPIEIEIRPSYEKANVEKGKVRTFQLTSNNLSTLYLTLNNMVETINNTKGPYANVTLKLALQPGQETPAALDAMEARRRILLEEEAKIVLRNQVIMGVLAGILIIGLIAAWVWYKRASSA